MPPADDVMGALKSILGPFDENGSDREGADPEDDERYTNTRYGFWDFYILGGRYAGEKKLARYGRESVAVFYEWCKAEKVTVSGFQMGKQELSPASQRAKVDAKWNEMFPADKVCPLFAHANDQLGKPDKSSLDGDVCRFADVPDGLTCFRAIIAAPSYSTKTKTHDGPVEAVYMVAKADYNGVSYIDSAWDGTLREALAAHAKRLEGCNPTWIERATPTDNWIVVTVDYHS